MPKNTEAMKYEPRPISETVNRLAEVERQVEELRAKAQGPTFSSEDIGKYDELLRELKQLREGVAAEKEGKVIQFPETKSEEEVELDSSEWLDPEVERRHNLEQQRQRQIERAKRTATAERDTRKAERVRAQIAENFTAEERVAHAEQRIGDAIAVLRRDFNITVDKSGMVLKNIGLYNRLVEAAENLNELKLSWWDRLKYGIKDKEYDRAQIKQFTNLLEEIEDANLELNPVAEKTVTTSALRQETVSRALPLGEHVSGTEARPAGKTLRRTGKAETAPVIAPEFSEGEKMGGAEEKWFKGGEEMAQKAALEKPETFEEEKDVTEKSLEQIAAPDIKERLAPLLEEMKTQHKIKITAVTENELRMDRASRRRFEQLSAGVDAMNASDKRRAVTIAVGGLFNRDIYNEQNLEEFGELEKRIISLQNELYRRVHPVAEKSVTKSPLRQESVSRALPLGEHVSAVEAGSARRGRRLGKAETSPVIAPRFAGDEETGAEEEWFEAGDAMTKEGQEYDLSPEGKKIMAKIRPLLANLRDRFGISISAVEPDASGKNRGFIMDKPNEKLLKQWTKFVERNEKARKKGLTASEHIGEKEYHYQDADTFNNVMNLLEQYQTELFNAEHPVASKRVRRGAAGRIKLGAKPKL